MAVAPYHDVAATAAVKVVVDAAAEHVVPARARR